MPKKRSSSSESSAPSRVPPQPRSSGGAPGRTDAKPRGTTQSHYFDAEPQAAAKERRLTVTLAGEKHEVVTSTGVFSGDRLDLGTSVLLREAPDPPAHGTLLDLGCGWGPIALTLGLLSPEADVLAVDINRRSLDLTARNAASLGLDRVRALTPEEVAPEATFETIWSNPPIRIGKQALHELLMAWLPRLAPGGAAYLVVGKNLGSDSLQTWLTGALGPGFAVSRLASAKGFRVLEVQRTDEPGDCG